MYIKPDEIKTDLLPWQKRGLQFTASGYGKKIPTNKKARIGKKWYRIYCCIFSNCGTCYIIKDKKHYIIEDLKNAK